MFCLDPAKERTSGEESLEITKIRSTSLCNFSNNYLKALTGLYNFVFLLLLLVAKLVSYQDPDEIDDIDDEAIDGVLVPNPEVVELEVKTEVQVEVLFLCFSFRQC